MTDRRRLILAFGGRSSEHEISIRSATEVLAALDRDRFTPVPLAIGRDGVWRTGAVDDPLPSIVASGQPVHDLRELRPELVFPVLHGPYGEDGTFQGLLDALGVPYVGSGVLASAMCMDKAVQKHFLAAAVPEIPLIRWIEIEAGGLAAEQLAERVASEVGYPCFVKPANMGSSVGVAAVDTPDELGPAVEQASRYDTKIVVEQGIDAREIEVAVLGNGGADTIVSVPGEIELPTDEWYDYDTKYTKDVATLRIPAELTPDNVERIREHALLAFRATGCKGLARIDFLLERESRVPYLNELNTMPGFTSISMYPKLMEHAGISYTSLITRLCELGLAHFETRQRLSTER